MSVLVLVRHGKASPLAADYDNLSETGVAQARLLGEEWAAMRARFDAVYVGPRRRHAQTHEAARAACREAGGPDWPEPTMLPELDEHDGLSLVFKTLPRIVAEGNANGTWPDHELAAIAEAMARGETPPLHQLLVLFKRITRMWVRREMSHDEVEPFHDFRKRVERGLAAMTNDVGRGKTIVAFTSAGAVAAGVGMVLGVGDEKVLDLSWSLHNGATTELAFSPENGGLLEWGLRTFNATPHLRDPKLLTSV